MQHVGHFLEAVTDFFQIKTTAKVFILYTWLVNIPHKFSSVETSLHRSAGNISASAKTEKDADRWEDREVDGHRGQLSVCILLSLLSQTELWDLVMRLCKGSAYSSQPT